MKTSPFRLCVTGGHLTPALAVIEAVRDDHPDWDIDFIGRERHGDRSKHTSEEKRRIVSLGIPFHSLVAGRFVRTSFFVMCRELVRTASAVIRSIGLLSKTHPDAVLSFGGYIGLPVGIAARIMGIPVYLHEQTMVPGRANRLLARVARHIFVAHGSVVDRLPKGKTTVVGLPIRRSVFLEGKKPAEVPPGDILYVMGGVAGAASLNTHVQKEIAGLTLRYVVVHQTGRDWEEAARRFKSALPAEAKARYYPYPYLDDEPHAWVLGHAHIILARSGANTVWEAIAKAVPAVFVPLPWSSGGEQEKNASFMESEGAAVILKQDYIVSGSIQKTVSKIDASYHEYKQNAIRLSESVPKDAAAQIVRKIAQMTDRMHP